MTLVTGGQVVRARFGMLELYGGFASLVLSALLIPARALTFGHVTLGRDRNMPRCSPGTRIRLRQASGNLGTLISTRLLLLQLVRSSARGPFPFR